MELEDIVLGVISRVHDPLEAIADVSSFGIPTCQLYTPPLKWQTQGNAAALKEQSSSTGVQITSLICAFRGEDYSSLDTIKRTVGLVNPSTREERMNWILACSDFAKGIGVSVLQGHLGFVPKRSTSEYEQLIKSVQKIADYFKKNSGQFFALETGQESGKELLQLIQDIGRDNVKVNFDPANFLIYNSDDPLAALEVLKEYVVGVHCKDARRPREKGILGSEVPLGEGELGIPAFIAKLKEFDYAGPLTIEREISSEEQWKKDVLKAKQLLESLI